MSARQTLQSAEGILERFPGIGTMKYMSSKITPTNTANPNGYGAGCEWYFTPPNGPPRTFMNIGGNGYYVGNTQNTQANWIEVDPTSQNQGQFGLTAGSAFFNSGGTLYRSTLGATTSSTPNAGIAPSAAGAFKIVDVFTLPANVFDTIGRTLAFSSWALFKTGSGLATQMQIIANPSNALIWPGNPAVNGVSPSAGAISGNAGITGISDGTVTLGTGTLLFDTGSQSLTGTNQINLQGELICTGVSTQESVTSAIVYGSTHGGVGAWSDQTITSTAAIVFVVVIKVATTAADLVYNGMTVQGYN